MTIFNAYQPISPDIEYADVTEQEPVKKHPKDLLIRAFRERMPMNVPEQLVQKRCENVICTTDMKVSSWIQDQIDYIIWDLPKYVQVWYDQAINDFIADRDEELMEIDDILMNDCAEVYNLEW